MMMSSLALSTRYFLSSSSRSTLRPPSTWTRKWTRRRRALRDRAAYTSSSAGVDDHDDETAIHDAIIVGGGPTGLLLSALLSSHGVRSHLLFDSRPVSELLKHPQAHFINVRSMEILRAEAPDVHEGVLRETPDVDEWEGFHFGGCVIEEGDDRGRRRGGGRRLGRVVHPVREPLRVGQRGDAVPVPRAGKANRDGAGNSTATTNADSPREASPCRPAHLAQNKFVSLLLQESRRHFDDDRDAAKGDADKIAEHPRLRYGEEVIGISQHGSFPSNLRGDNGGHPTPVTTIRTSLGKSYRARYLLAADGVHSFTRKHFGIPMMGESSMQSLINVHFRTNDGLSKLLMRRSSRCDDRAMLHFTYNSQLVGAFVCHDGNEGEWVLQVPFFPPFQTMVDFDTEKVRGMIWAGLLGAKPKNEGRRGPDDDNLDFEILSIRPWTMSSLVAQRYLNEYRNVVLVGDAAHSFPPAGGFGMNTGLQDAHNIAWRLALLLNREKKNELSEDAHLVDENAEWPPSGPTSASFSDAILSKYEEERKPIATQNAALSVRNYRRTLRIAKACYLDAQHPQLLMSMLDAPPMNLLPMVTRREMFRRLVDVAMMPLGSLVSPQNSGGGSFHADHVERNVWSILEGGGSLPLVFPRYELGFSYDSDDASESHATNDESGDTAGYFPRLGVGHRMPHVPVEFLVPPANRDGEGWAVVEATNLCLAASISEAADASPGSTKLTSLTDISSRLRRASSCISPIFTLLAFGPALTSSVALVGEAANCVAKMWNVPLMLLNVLPARPDVEEHAKEAGFAPYGRESKGFDVLYAVDEQQSLLKLLCDEHLLTGSNTGEKREDLVNALIMVRPDSHIADISLIDDGRGGAGAMTDQIRRSVERGLRNSLGDVVLDG